MVDQSRQLKKQESFLAQAQNHQRWCVVGPMFKEEFAQNVILKLTELTAHWPTIYVDRGADFLTSASVPQLKVGDGDSAKTQMDINLNPDKDFSDFEYALELIAPTVEIVYCLGFLGGRLDHELANLGAIFHLLNARPQKLKVLLGEKILAVSAGEWELNLQGEFSLLSLAPTKMTIAGAVKYPLKSTTELRPFQGYTLSNYANGIVRFMSTSPVFVFSEHCFDLGSLNF